MTVTKIKLWGALLVGALVVAGLYVLGDSAGYTPPDTSKQGGKVVRVEVTLTAGSFEPTLHTVSSVSGPRVWTQEGRTYTVRYAQDVFVARNERTQFWLTAATDIDRNIDRRTLKCQLYVDGKPLSGEAADSRVIRAGESGEPVGCSAMVQG